jgi:hypothetical protein
MRTMTKKSGVIAALTAALVLMTVLVIANCRIPDTGSVIDTIIGAGSDIDIEPGTETAKNTGYVRLNFGNKKVARTIVPEAPELADFLGYEVTFTPITTGTYKQVTVGTGGDIAVITANITLDEGDYEVEVVAFLDAARAKPVAVATTGLAANGGGICTDKLISLGGVPVEEIPITDGGVTQIYVTLKPYGVTTGNGIFSWKITDKFTYEWDSATLTVTDWPTANPLTTQTINITPDDNLIGSFGDDDPLLASGYKRVVLTLTGTEGDKFTLREVAHIYRSLTSIFEYEFVDGLVIAPPPPPGTGTGRITIEYDHGEGINFSFDVDVSGTTSNLIASGDIGSATNPVRLSRSDTTFPNQVTLTLSISGTTLDSYKWILADDDDPEEDIDLGSPTAPFILNAYTNANFSANKVYGILLEGVKDGAPYSLDDVAIYIKVMP